PDTPVSLSPFDVVDADFEASARQVLFGDRRLGRSHAVITSGRGEINLTVDDTRLYGGNLSGTTRILAGKQGLTAKSDFKVTKARAVSLLDALLGVDTVGGTLSADINFSAAGGT